MCGGIGCARPDLNRDAPRGALAPRASASTYFRHERRRAATRGRTGPSAVRRRSRKPCAAARLGYQASNLEKLPVQSRAGLPVPPYPNEYAGRDLNPHTARFELASFAG